MASFNVWHGLWNHAHSSLFQNYWHPLVFRKTCDIHGTDIMAEVEGIGMSSARFSFYFVFNVIPHCGLMVISVSDARPLPSGAHGLRLLHFFPLDSASLWCKMHEQWWQGWCLFMPSESLLLPVKEQSCVRLNSHFKAQVVLHVSPSPSQHLLAFWGFFQTFLLQLIPASLNFVDLWKSWAFI